MLSNGITCYHSDWKLISNAKMQKPAPNGLKDIVESANMESDGLFIMLKTEPG